MANLITNPDFETDTTGWSNGSASTITRDNTHVHGGSWALKAAFSANETAGTNWRMAAFSGLTLSNGTDYQLSCSIYIPTAWNSGRIVLELWDFTNAVQVSGSNAVMSTRDAYQTVTFTATANSAANQGLRVGSYIDTGFTSATSGDAIWIDDASLSSLSGSAGINMLLLGIG